MSQLGARPKGTWPDSILRVVMCVAQALIQSPRAERSEATNADPWVIGLRRRRPSLVVAVALANKTARIAWAVMHRQESYQRMAMAA